MNLHDVVQRDAECERRRIVEPVEVAFDVGRPEALDDAVGAREADLDVLLVAAVAAQSRLRKGWRQIGCLAQRRSMTPSPPER